MEASGLEMVDGPVCWTTPKTGGGLGVCTWVVCILYASPRSREEDREKK